MRSSLPPQFASARRKFIEGGGSTTQSFGLGRITGQVFALIYLCPRPMCLDEIVHELGVSKASVSTTVRQLMAWSAIKRVWVKGDRKDYYEAETNFGAILRSGLTELARKKVNTAGVHLANVERSLQEALAKTNGETDAEARVIAERLNSAKQFHQKVSDLLNSPLFRDLI